MPIYEYRRPDGSTFEVQQSFSDATLTHDPDTGVPVERVLHAPGVALQGQGLLQHRLRHAQSPARGRRRCASEDSSAKKDSSSDGDSKKSSDKGSPAQDGKAKGEKTSSDGAKPKDAKPAPAKS